MLRIIRRLRRWWRVRRMTQVRDALIHYGDPQNPKIQWTIDALTRAIEDAKREATHTGRQP